MIAEVARHERIDRSICAADSSPRRAAIANRHESLTRRAGIAAAPDAGVDVRILPAVDLHLLLDAQVPLTLFGQPTPTTWGDLTSRPGFTMSLAPATVVSLSGQTITATAVGTQMGDLQFEWTGQTPLHVACRMTVHHTIRQLFVPQPTLTLETGRTDRILSVYAQFETAAGVRSTHDVTSLPYLQYDVATTAGSPLVIVDQDTGRITSGGSAGSVRITVSVDPALVPAGPTAIVDVTIVPRPVDRPILQPIHTGAGTRKKSILFLPDGFTVEQRPLFESLARKMTTHLFASVSPYKQLRDSFDAYVAFVPSQEPGVSMAPPIGIIDPSNDVAVTITPETVLEEFDFTLDQVLDKLGLPTATSDHASASASMVAVDPERTLSLTTFNLWRSLLTPPEQPRVRETAFGLMMGERHHGSAATATTVPSIELVKRRLANRFVRFDDRRLPDLAVGGRHPNIAHHPEQDAFVSKLRTPDGPPGFGGIWARGGESHGLIIYLVHSDHFGGVKIPGNLAMSIGDGIRVLAPPSLLVPGLRDIELVARSATGEPAVRGFTGIPNNVLADVMAHELAHTVALGGCADEYGRENGQPSASEGAAIDARSNVQWLASATTPPATAIESAKLTWNWERVEAAATLTAAMTASGALLTVVVGEDLARWPAGTIGRSVFLRTAKLSRQHSPDLVIRDVQQAAQTLQLEDLGGAASAAALAAQFLAGSKVVMPRLISPAVPRRLVDALVFPALAGGPFGKSSGTCQEEPAPHPPAIPGLALPANANQLLAAYESGGTHRCGVIRPAAECKMRHNIADELETPVEFCFVCKYIIVDAVDCAQLASLDREYPR